MTKLTPSNGMELMDWTIGKIKERVDAFALTSFSAGLMIWAAMRYADSMLRHLSREDARPRGSDPGASIHDNGEAEFLSALAVQMAGMVTVDIPLNSGIDTALRMWSGEALDPNSTHQAAFRARAKLVSEVTGIGEDEALSIFENDQRQRAEVVRRHGGTVRLAWDTLVASTSQMGDDDMRAVLAAHPPLEMALIGAIVRRLEKMSNKAVVRALTGPAVYIEDNIAKCRELRALHVAVGAAASVRLREFEQYNERSPLETLVGGIKEVVL